MGKDKKKEQFKNSLLPKRGNGKATETLDVFVEPDPNSKKVDTVEKGELLSWIGKSLIGKSLCPLEMLRLDVKKFFGYIIGRNKEGKYNIDTESIVEEKKAKNLCLGIKFEVKPGAYTEEEYKMVEKAKVKVLDEIKFNLELKNDYVEDKPDDESQEATMPEEQQMIFDFDDLKDDENNQYLNDSLDYLKDSQIKNIRKENEKLTKEIQKVFNEDKNDKNKKEGFNDTNAGQNNTKISSGNGPIFEKNNPKPKSYTLPENEEKPNSPEKPEEIEIQKESDSELDENRRKIVEQARQYIGSTYWTKEEQRTSFDGEVTFEKGEYKCNLFIYEVLKQNGIDTGLPNDYYRIFKQKQKRPHVCKQWYAEKVPKFKCIGIGKEALKQSKPGDIITDGSHLGIISGPKKTISASSIINEVVENGFGWWEGEQDIVKVFRYMGEGYSSKEVDEETAMNTASLPF